MSTLITIILLGFFKYSFELPPLKYKNKISIKQVKAYKNFLVELFFFFFFFFFLGWGGGGGAGEGERGCLVLFCDCLVRY